MSARAPRVALPAAWRPAVAGAAGLSRRGPVRLALAGVLAAFLLAWPYLAPSSFYVHVSVIMLIYVPLAVGQNVITGTSGQVSMGHAAFYGVGAYVTAILTTRVTSTPALVAVLASVAVTAAVGLVVSVPAIRVSGDYLFIVTIGLNLIFVDVVTQWRGATGGASGTTGVPVFRLFGWEALDEYRFYWVALAASAAVILVAAAMATSRIGRALEAARDDAAAAVASGLGLTRVRVVAFVVGAGMAGVSGALFAYYIGFVGPQNFDVQQSLIIFEMAIIGGLGSIRGSVAGALLLVAVPEVFRVLQDDRLGLGGALLVVLMIFRPNGLLGSTTIQPMVKR